MNERKMNELAIKSGGIWRGGHVEQPNGDSVWTEQKWVDPCDMDLNKFADLIIQDCIEIVEPCKCGCCDGEPEGIIADTIIKQIKDHFGVE